MKERVSIQRTAQTGYLAINREAIGKERGVVFSIISAVLREKTPQAVRVTRQRPHRAS